MENYSNELTQLIELKKNQHRPVSALTLKKYIQEYLHLTKLLKKQDDWITDASTDSLVRIINNLKLSATGVLNYLNLFIMIRMDNLDIKILLDLRDKYNKRKDINTKAKVLHKKETLPSHNVIVKYIDGLYKTKQYTDYLVNYFIYTYGLRNRDVNLNIITNANYKNIHGTLNYAIIRKTDSVLVINDYKTSGTYGQKKIICRSRRVLDCLNKLKEGPLLVNKYNEPVNDENIAYRIHLYENLGEGDYYKIILNYLQTKPNSIKHIAKIATSRGSMSIDTLNKYYNINV
jgi:hypothetical protein